MCVRWRTIRELGDYFDHRDSEEESQNHFNEIHFIEDFS
jgi:hypothetical protein